MEAYYGRIFVGNHCNKYFSKAVIEALCKSVFLETAKHTNDENILAEARAIGAKFSHVNKLFREVHTTVSRCAPVDDVVISEARAHIAAYMKTFREYFPGKVIPKMHFWRSI